MANPSRPTSHKAPEAANQQKKLRLIGVLVLAFAAVLYVQFFSSEADLGDASIAGEMPAEAPTVPIAPAIATLDWTPALGREFTVVTLRSRTIEQILDRQPFVLPKPEEPTLLAEVEIQSEPEPVPEIPREPDPQPEPLEVRATYATAKRSVALVGEAIVRSGEQLPDGRKLVAAGPQGLQTAKRNAVSEPPPP